MAQIEIPTQWRDRVTSVLATEETGTLIEWTLDAEREFQRSFPDAWTNQVYGALALYLEGRRPAGCPIKMHKPLGQTYEFIFTFRGKPVYGKILLRPDLQRIVIFSAHLPEKSKLSCE